MLNEGQNKLLQMLKWFNEYCHCHNLSYYAVGGTMLGVIRHKGFIPWDDDVDVALPRPDYMRLIELFNHESKGRYVLESPYNENDDYYYAYAKLYDTTTTLVEKSKRNCKRGLYIDIFPLDGVGKTEKEAMTNFRKFDRLHMFLMTRVCAIERRRGTLKNLSIILSRLIPQFIVNDHDLIQKIDKTASSFGYETNSYIASLMGSYRSKEVMKRSIFGRPTEYQFEDISIDGVEFYEEYLEHLYGDWKQLPPQEQRKTSHSYIEMDLNKSWMDN